MHESGDRFEDKSGARRVLKAGLSRLSDLERRDRSARIRARLLEQPEVGGALRFMVYVSRGYEVDTQGLIEELLARGQRVAAPRCVPDRWVMEAYEIRDPARDLAPGYMGIAEPDPARCRLLPAEEIDLLVAPVLGFTASGDRMGRGQGFFDRFLLRLSDRCVKAGLAFECQKMPLLPMEPHDRPLDMVVTEANVYRC